MSESDEETLEIRVVLKKNQIERFGRIQEDLGIESRADVLRHLISLYPLPPPRFEHINTYDDHITIKDNVLNREANIYLKTGGEAFCDVCQLQDCLHINYALALPSVVRVLEAKGWTRKRLKSL